MKKFYLLFIVAASLMMNGCLKDGISTTTTFTGRVLSSNNTPSANCRITIAHSCHRESTYSHSYSYDYDVATTYTDANGDFSLTLDCQNVPNSCFNDKYLFVSTRRYPLMGLGQETYDYGTIVI